MIGKYINVIVDRPLGTHHLKYTNIVYNVNYGYVENIMGGDGEGQDVYVLGINEPVKEFYGKVIAIIHRLDDVEDKWVVAPDDMTFTKEEISKLVSFQEKYFKTEIIM